MCFCFHLSVILWFQSGVFYWSTSRFSLQFVFASVEADFWPFTLVLSLVRFRPMSVFHEGDGDESGFTCCAFSAGERFLMLGTCSGRLKLYNVFSGEEEASYTCHTSAITHLEPSKVPFHMHSHIYRVFLLEIWVFFTFRFFYSFRMENFCSPLPLGASRCLPYGVWMVFLAWSKHTHT